MEKAPDIAVAYWAGMQAWPACELDLATFAGHVEVVRITDALPKHTNDLYLACAAANGDARAVEEIARRLPAIATVALGRAAPQLVACVLARVHDRLLVARPDARPQIADYRGAGPLALWLRDAIVRVATRARRLQREDLECPCP